MWLLTYNGITLQINHAAEYKRETVMAGTSYLWTKHRLVVEGIYNPALNAYLPQGVGRVVAANGRNVIAVRTDAALRHKLLQPRKQLTFVVSGINALVSPLPGYVCDANNGPIPLDCTVTEMAGAKTFFVRWAVDTYLQEYDLTQNRDSLGKSPSPLVGHHWEMTSEIDQHYFEHRYIRGTAVFRRDRLEQLQRVPDDFRVFLFHPALPGFQRIGVRCIQRDDGVTFDYEIHDQQQHVSHIYKNIAEIQVEASSSKDQPDPVAAFGGGVRAVGEAVFESKFAPFMDERHTNLSRTNRAWARSVGAVFGTFIGSLPTVQNQASVKVYGTPKATREELLTVLEGWEFYLMSKLSIYANLGEPNSIDVHISLTEPLAILQVNWHAGPPGSLKGGPFKWLNNLNDMTCGGRFNFPSTTFRHYPTNFNSARGTKLEAIVAAALHDTGLAPDSPGVGKNKQRNVIETAP